MLNADDLYTPDSLARLKQAIREERPIVIWIGAGASRWAGLPSWHESAAKMRRAFRRIPGFSEAEANEFISLQDYPAAFELYRNVNNILYNKTLLTQFSSPAIGLLYRQLISKLRAITPLHVVTTNVDLCLEQNLDIPQVIENTDIERLGQCINSGASFIAKLHGSTSSIESVVFTTADYESLTTDSRFISAVKSLFSQASIVFLGYGLRDEYVLKLIAKDESEHRMYGNGPHFLLTDSPGPAKDGVYRIGYKTLRYLDHRAALTVLDVIKQSQNRPISETLATNPATTPSKESGFYISDFQPSGTRITGHTLHLRNNADHETQIRALVGLGFQQGELPSSETVAFHDLAVGLLCFDLVYLPLGSIGTLHDYATSEVFWQLVDAGPIKFVDTVHDPAFVSPLGDLFGEIVLFRNQPAHEAETRTSMNKIREILKPAPERTSEGEKKIDSLAKIVLFSESDTLDLPAMVRDALLLPRVSELLGYSDYVLPTSIPCWLAYPTIRLTHLVQTGLICDQLHIRAARVPFGGNSLLSAVFSVKPAEQSVYEYASFVLTGAYGTNLSTYIERNPTTLLQILAFRESSEGVGLRREISDRLETNEGTEFSAAIEGSLKRAIPAAMLQAARNKFSNLMKTTSLKASAAAVWGDNNADDLSLRLWRERSRQLLLIEAKTLGLKLSSDCLCGSGDPLRECCLRALAQG